MSVTICTIPIPGPQGLPGAPGADGTDGASAFTSTTASFVLPDEGDVVTVDVVSSAGLAAGQVVYVTAGGALAYVQVVSAPDAASLVLLNLADSTTGAYALNSAPGTSFASGASVAPSGPQGPTGASGVSTGLYLEIAQDLADISDASTARLNLGLGSAAQFAAGIGDGQVALNDGDLVTSQLVFSTSNGLRTLDAPSARTQIGLGTAAVADTGTADGLLPLVDDVAGLANGEVVFATASGLQSLDAASARTALGIINPSGGALDMLLFQHREASGTAGGSFTSGSRQTVPLNTEIIDTGNHGSIAGNQITLASGTYRYRYGIIGFECGSFQGNLFNLTTPGVIADSYGSLAQTVPAGVTSAVSHGEGRLVLATPTVIRLEAQCSTTEVIDGFGAAGSFGGGEVYSWLSLERE